MDVRVENQAQDEDKNNNYIVNFAKIKTVSLASTQNDLYVRFDLGGKLPISNKKMPFYPGGDQLKGLYFFLDFKNNYFDSLGRKNTGKSDASLEISFYGEDTKIYNENKINIEGKIVDGGPGHNYFIVKYPYDSVLFNQNVPNVVISAFSLTTSQTYGLNASTYYLKNSMLAASADSNTDINITLWPKK